MCYIILNCCVRNDFRTQYIKDIIYYFSNVMGKWGILMNDKSTINKDNLEKKVQQYLEANKPRTIDAVKPWKSTRIIRGRSYSK